MVDEDTRAFNKLMDAFGLPNNTPADKDDRATKIQEATRYAAEVPFKTMQLCFESLEILNTMVDTGNPNSVTDAGVGALAARAGVLGAYLNVKIRFL